MATRALDGVSRTGVTVDGGSAFVGVNGGTVISVDLADGGVDWRRSSMRCSSPRSP